MSTLDPYKIMQVDKRNYTYEQLRANFKRLVLEYHPDRNNLNREKLNESGIFQTLKFSYDYLVSELEAKRSDKTHFELKEQAKAQAQAPPPQEAQAQAPHTSNNVRIPTGRKFDIATFNAVFTKERINEAYDQGYGDWKEDTPPAPKAIIAYKDPEPFAMGRFASAYELGKEHVGDFSGDTLGTNLKYMDFKLAHTTSLLVDPSTLEARPEHAFTTVEQIKHHRATAPLQATEEDLRKRHLEQEEDAKREEARLDALKQKDSLIDSWYKKTHALMLQTFGK